MGAIIGIIYAIVSASGEWMGQEQKIFSLYQIHIIVNHKLVPFIQESSSSSLVSTLKRGPGDDGEFGVATSIFWVLDLYFSSVSKLHNID